MKTIYIIMSNAKVLPGEMSPMRRYHDGKFYLWGDSYTGFSSKKAAMKAVREAKKSRQGQVHDFVPSYKIVRVLVEDE